MERTKTNEAAEKIAEEYGDATAIIAKFASGMKLFVQLAHMSARPDKAEDVRSIGSKLLATVISDCGEAGMINTTPSNFLALADQIIDATLKDDPTALAMQHAMHAMRHGPGTTH